MFDRRHILKAMGGLTIAATLPSIVAAQAVKQQPSKRIALVIGAQEYDAESTLSKLRTPINDAQAVAAKLTELGIDTRTLKNPRGSELREALAAFGDRARDANLVIVYYAGHGLQATQDGSVAAKFFAPIDFRVPGGGQAADVSKAFREAVDSGEIIGLNAALRSVRGTSKVGIVFWDACRNNPFFNTPIALSSGATKVSQASGQLMRSASPQSETPSAASVPLVDSAPIKITGPRGIVIQSATMPGQGADDGLGTHSPYTTALLKHLATPGMTIDAMMGAVATDVHQASGGRQVPQIEKELIGGEFALVPAVRPSPQANSSASSGNTQRPSSQQRAPDNRRPNGVDCVGQGCKSTATFSDGKKVTIETMGASALD